MIKIIKDDRVRHYEMTFLLPTNYSSTEISKLLDSLDALLVKHSAKVVSKDEWGEKGLAYPIRFKGKPVQSSLYYHWLLEAPAENVQKMEKDIRLIPDVVRFLLVQSDQKTATKNS